MEWFQKILSKEWIITPAGGLTGDAYIATNGDKRLFLKRNSSPFFSSLVCRRNRSEINLDKTNGERGCYYRTGMDGWSNIKSRRNEAGKCC